MRNHVFWLSEVGPGDKGSVGPNCSNLGWMTKLKLPVPIAFAIAASAQKAFLEKTSARREIQTVIKAASEVKDHDILAEVSAKIQAVIDGKKMPPAIEDAITSHYDDLCSKRGYEVAVSARPAGIVIYPGMYETYLNIRGALNLVAAVKKVWASIFSHPSACLAVQRGLTIPYTGISVIEVVSTRSAGVFFAVDPVTGDRSRAVIEANWGLGESVVSGRVDADRYVIDKKNLKVIGKTLGQKDIQIVPRGHGVAEEKIPAEQRKTYALSDEEASEVVRIGTSVESRCNAPQNLVFAIADDRPFPENVVIFRVWSCLV